ncbi:MAG: hypothetical protein Q9191_005105 [Dirinaria sp. TL-2023a]
MASEMSRACNNLESICEEPLSRESDDVPSEDRPASSPSASSYSSISFSINSNTPLHPSGAGSEIYHNMIESEKKIVERAERSRMDNFARELYDKLVKLSRRLSGDESEEEKNARELREACQQTLLYLRVKGGNDSTVSLAASSGTSSLRHRLAKWASRSSVNSPRKNSRSSTPSAASRASNTPARSDSFEALKNLMRDSEPSPSQRRISLPLEQDPVWRMNQRYFRQGSISSKPLFREPLYEPEDDEPTSCEIVHVISNPTDPLCEVHTVYPGSESPVHRLSDSPRSLQKKVFTRFGSRDGNETFSEVQEFDSQGRRKVRLVWGTKVDQIIPHFRRDEPPPPHKVANVTTCNSEDESPKRKRWQQQLGEKCHNGGKLLKEHGKKLFGRK